MITRYRRSLIIAIQFIAVAFMLVMPTPPDALVFEFVVSRGLVVFLWIQAIDVIASDESEQP